MRFMMLRDKHNRHPCAGLMFAVDSFGKVLRFDLQLLINCKFAAGRRCNLHQYEFFFPLGIVRYERIHGAHAVENSFGVIEPFDSDGDFGLG